MPIGVLGARPQTSVFSPESSATLAERKQLELEWRRRQDELAHLARVQIEQVRDNGLGFGNITPAPLLSASFTTRKKGMDQGLSICKRIIDAHNGLRWAEPNQRYGAIFNLRLPLPGGDDGSAPGWRISRTGPAVGPDSWQCPDWC